MQIGLPMDTTPLPFLDLMKVLRAGADPETTGSLTLLPEPMGMQSNGPHPMLELIPHRQIPGPPGHRVTVEILVLSVRDVLRLEGDGE